MAIIVYTSVNSNPITTKQDGVIDLSSTGVLPSNVDIYAAAVDTENPSASFSFQWYLLAKPSGSAVSILNTLDPSTTLQDVDLWGNYRLFCIAQNTSTGAFSESDILKAPNSSFLNINVISQFAAIEKPAKGERNWYDKANVWADKIANLYEDLGGLAGLPVLGGTTAHTIGFAGDTVYSIQGTINEIEVTGTNGGGVFENKIGLPNSVHITTALSIGAAGSGSLQVNGSANLGSGYVEGSLQVDDTLQVTNEITANSDIYIGGRIESTTSPFSALTSNGTIWSLEKNSLAASEIMTVADVPTTTKRGGVLLEEAGFNTSGKLPGREWFTLTASVSGTNRIAVGDNNWTNSSYIETYSSGSAAQWCHVVFPIHIPGTIKLHKVSCITNGNGNLAGASPDRYGFQVVRSKSPESNDWTNISGSESGWSFTTAAGGESYATQIRSYTWATPATLDDTYHIGILVTSQPGISDPATRLHVTITGYRLIGE